MLAHEIQELVAAAFAGKGGKGWVRADCPMCIEITGKDDMRQSMGLNMATGGFNCLAAETMVQTWDGCYPISELAGGTHRLLTTCAQGHSRWVYAPVSSFGEQTLQDVVISRNGVEKTIRATPKHRWFVKSGQRFLERTTDQLKPGQYLRGVKLPHSGALRPSSWGVAHGFTYGDGTELQREDKGCRAYFCGEKDHAMLEFFIGSSEVKTDTTGRVYIDHLPRFFKSLPDLNETPAYLYGWLSGYFAADGCVDATGHPTMASADRENLEFVRRLCTRLGILTYGIREQMRLGYGTEPSALYQLSISRSALSEEFFKLQAHRERWLANPSVRERTSWVIKSVGAPGAPEEVFCATVEGFGCFALEDNLLTGNCFKCGTTGWLLPQLMDLQEWEVEDVDVEREPPQLATGFVPLYHGDGLGSSALEPARAYLRRRGITDEIGAAADIGTAVWGWLSGYVIVPIPNYENPEAPWKGWFARDYTGFKEQKHRYPKRMSRLDTLWNEQALWERTDEPVIVTEGILDALPYYPDGVACLGKPIDAHVQLFLRAQRPIVMCLDGDAHEEGWAYAMKLRFLGLRAFSVRLPPNQDPNSVDPQWLREQVQNAVESGQD